MVVVKSELAREPGVAQELVQLFAASKARAPAQARDRAPIGRAAVAASVRVAADFAWDQGLLPRRMADDEIWRYSPE